MHIENLKRHTAVVLFDMDTIPKIEAHTELQVAYTIVNYMKAVMQWQTALHRDSDTIVQKQSAL